MWIMHREVVQKWRCGAEMRQKACEERLSGGSHWLNGQRQDDDREETGAVPPSATRQRSQARSECSARANMLSPEELMCWHENKYTTCVPVPFLSQIVMQQT